MGREEQIVNERFRKIKELKKEGINPYPHTFDKKNDISECLKSALKTKVKTAGRIITKRDIGKIIFCNLRDSSGEMQIVFQKGEIKDKDFEFAGKYLDAGDFIGIEGTIFKTKTKKICVGGISVPERQRTAYRPYLFVYRG